MRPIILAGASALALAAAPAIAGQNQTETKTAAAAEPASDETITITGSRIRRTGFDTLEPALVVSQEYLNKRGLTNVADALNELPGFGVGVTPEGGQSGFGVGQNFVNRFGLGSQRTLTVVNGRRFVSSNAASIFGPGGNSNGPGLQVDLNILPQIMVDRIENISIGGAPTYGSDAIAGTVNIILKKKFEGIEIRALTGLAERGDAFRLNLQGMAGTNFGPDDRGNVMLAVSYDKADGVKATQRPRNAASIGAFTNPVASTQPLTRDVTRDGRIFNTPMRTGLAGDTTPAAVYIRDRRLAPLTFGGLLFPGTGGTSLADGTPRGFGAAGTTRFAFGSDGRLFPYNPGFPYGTTDASGGDGLNLQETAPLLNDLWRVTVAANAEYEIFTGVRAFAEGMYYKAESLEIIDQPIYNATLFGGLSAPLTFQVTDPRLNAADRATLQGLGVTSFRLSRASRDIINNNASGENQLFRIVGGFDGDFSIGNRRFNWEATVNYGKSLGFYTANVLDQQRFVNAINVTTNAQGQIVCNAAITAAQNVAPGGILPIADPNCVPLDVFGENRRSQAALDYVTTSTRARSVLEQTVFNANIGGSPFDIFGNEVGFNAGYERRVERAEFDPDAFQRAGRGRAVPIGGNRGSFTTNEVFGEVLIPLVSPQNNVPFIYSLQGEAKVRYVDNTVNGGFTAYTLGGRWAPVADIEFRGNFTRSLRAPSVTELFTPVSPAFNTVPDPCDERNITQGAKPATRLANCTAFLQALGIARPFQSTAVTATVPVTIGGDPGLANEASNSWSAGVVLRPSFLPGFRAAVDWNEILIRGPISNLNATQIANACFDNDSFNTADVLNANGFCSRIARLPNGQISADPLVPGVRGGFVNGQRIDMKALTAEVAYSWDWGKLGQFDLNANLFYLDTLTFDITGIVPDPQAGEVGDSKWQGQVQLGWTSGKWGVDVIANYQDGAMINVLDTPTTRDRIFFDDYVLVNTNITYQLKEQTFIRLAVTNLFNKQPPWPLGGVGTYDTLLRRYALSVQHRF
jgi:outer membrane receptor protein involved in Fe transport